MKNVHFYKARCRLGLLNIPYGSDQVNRGVEEGPDAVLTPEFLASWNPKSSVDFYTFPNPDTIDKSHDQEIIAREYSDFATSINRSIKVNETQVVVGGDHSVTFASMLALMKRVDPKDISYIQFDSHADIHSFRSSPSGNFHGMYVRALVDNVESAPVQALVRKKLPVKNILYIGNHVNEQEEWNFIHENKIKVISRSVFLRNRKKKLENVKAFALSRRHLHISFDVDIFDKSIRPATGILVEDGFFPADVFPILKELRHVRSLSVDLVEVNPRKEGAENTIKLAQKILKLVVNS